MPKSLLRHIYHTLLNDGSCPSCSAEEKVDQVVAKAVICSDDSELGLDLRWMNGKVNSTLFDAFWNELQAFFSNLH